MASPAVSSPYHAVDLETGYLETTGSYGTAFNAERKLEFLRLFRLNSLGFYRTCKDLSLSHATVNHHMEIDPQFKADVEACRREYADELESKSRSVAITKDSATLERIFQLRALLPDKYARDLKGNGLQKIEINVAGDFISSSKGRAKEIDAEVTQEIEVTTQDAIQIPISSTEGNTTHELKAGESMGKRVSSESHP